MTVPAYPGGAGDQPASAGPAPKEVQTAFQLWIANVVLGVIGTFIGFAISGAVTDELVKRTPGIDAASARGTSTLSVVVGVAFIVIYLVLAFQMRGGKNWARITLTVLGGIGVVFGLIGFLAFGLLISVGILGILNVLLTVVSIVILVAAIYFMFRPASNAYFSAPKYS